MYNVRSLDWGVGVLGNDRCFLSGIVDQLGLVIGVDRADGDTVYAARNEIVDEALLFCRSWPGILN